jgi:MATE family multidrug resistance protein
MRLALPLILSSSFLTLQLTIDRALLSQAASVAVAAALPAAAVYWALFALVQNTANYSATFVAQYLGAGRPLRLGPAVWQGLYFSIAAGLLFLGLRPLAPLLFPMGLHDEAVRQLEIAYFRCLCFAALPALIVAAVNGFFSGRGDSWTVLIIDAVGLAVNAPLAYALIFGEWGFPALGIEGAGWATVVGSTISAALALFLFLRPKYQTAHATRSGWRFEAGHFWRLMRFGVPNGLQWMLDGLAFTMFLFLVGKLGLVPLAATNIAFAINLVALLPMLGMGQAVLVLVGQRLGQDRPDLAERSTWTGFWMAWTYMSAVALLYILLPGMFLYIFGNKDENWAEIALLVPVLLRFVAVYSLFDSINIVFSFALRGAGDTLFVSALSLGLAWPIMVLPTWLALELGWGLYWAWAFASAYVIALGIAFILRFRTGKWKSMRVIEQAPVLEESWAAPVAQAATEPVH